MKKPIYNLHVLGIPHTKTSLEYTTCAFTQKVFKFCKMMKDAGHKVIHYGNEGSNPECDENVIVCPDVIFNAIYGNRDKRAFYDVNNTPVHTVFWYTAIEEINKRLSNNDILINPWGVGNQKVVDAFKDKIPCIHLGIGYTSPSEEGIPFKVFESNQLRSAYYLKNGIVWGRPEDTVIPNYFNVNDFTYNEDKEDWFLYLGRVADIKGFDNVLKACEYCGVKLKVAGQCADQYYDPEYKFPDFVEYLGPVGLEERRELFSKAKASFLITRYVEPFGGTQIESFLSGTPVITTDFGVFPETNINGVTGFICRNLKEVIEAIQNIDKINPEDCRKQGLKYTLEKIAPLYEKFIGECVDLFNGKNAWDL